MQLSVASVVLEVALKVPEAHAAHCRSLLAVAATMVRNPGAHGALTALHSLPSSLAEYVKPAVHAAHSRFDVAEPLLKRPWPTGQVVHAAQLSVASVELVVALNVPEAHAAHWRSLLAVAATVVRKPGPHATPTGRQVALLFTSE